MSSTLLTAEPVTLRPADVGDDALLRTLFAADRLPVLLDEQYAARAGAHAAAWAVRRDQVIEVGGVALGRLLVGISATEWRVVDVAVLPAHRGRGIGETTLARLVGEADDAGVAVSLRVDHGNRARNLYERLGFTVVAEEPTQHVMKREVPA